MTSRQLDKHINNICKKYCADITDPIDVYLLFEEGRDAYLKYETLEGCGAAILIFAEALRRDNEKHS